MPQECQLATYTIIHVHVITWRHLISVAAAYRLMVIGYNIYIMIHECGSKFQVVYTWGTEFQPARDSNI